MLINNGDKYVINITNGSQFFPGNHELQINLSAQWTLRGNQEGSEILADFLILRNFIYIFNHAKLKFSRLKANPLKTHK